MPDFKAEIRQRLEAVSLSPTREQEIIEELSQHLDDEYEQLLRGPASETEALSAVLRRLDESDLLSLELKRVEPRTPRQTAQLGTERTSNLLTDLGQDLRYGLRMLLRWWRCGISET